jgi:hypothetical protein
VIDYQYKNNHVKEISVGNVYIEFEHDFIEKEFDL